MCYRGRGWGGVRNPPRSRGGARLVKLIYSVLIRNRLHVIVFLLLLLPSSVALFFALPVTSKIFVHYNLQGFIVPPAINIFENRRLFEEFFLHLIMPLEKDVFFSFFFHFLSFSFTSATTDILATDSPLPKIEYLHFFHNFIFHNPT